MNNSNIIYEKRFAKLSMEDYDQVRGEPTKELTSYKRQNSEILVKNMLESIVRIVIPDRTENCGFFIAMAKEVAEHNEVNTVITEYEDRYVAAFCIDNDSTSFGLKELIEYADAVSFGCDGENAVVRVIYYTHATYRSGKQVTPEKQMDF